MSFFWGKSKDDGTSKSRQVSDLLSCFPSIRRPNNDDNSFELVFETADFKVNTLRILLPSDFPATKPLLQVTNPMSHPWLDQYKRVTGSDKLNYWDKKKYSLREVVEETLSELRRCSTGQQQLPKQQQGIRHSYSSYPSSMQQQQQYPVQDARHSYSGAPNTYQKYQYPQGQQPPPSNIPPNTMGASDLSNYHNSNNSQSLPHGGFTQPVSHQNQYTHGYAFSSQQSKIPQEPKNPSNQRSTHQEGTSASYHRDSSSSADRYQISLPGVPSEFPELQKLQESQLQRLLSDEVALKSHAASMDCVDTLRSMRDDLRRSNAEDAKRVVKKMDENRNEEEEVLILQNQLRATFNAYKMKLAQYSEQYAKSKLSIVSHLNKEVAAINNLSEETAQQFVDGKMDVGTFMQDYLSAREQYHRMKLTIKQAS